MPGWSGTYIPNFSDWRPGDVVLVGQGPGVKGNLVSATQAFSIRRSSRVGHAWTHAALYVGAGQVVEAVFPEGVVQSSVWKYCHHRAILVRRLDDPFSPIEGLSAAKLAQALIGRPYSALEVLRSKLMPRTKPKQSKLYCSTFVGFTLNASTGYSLYALPEHLPLYPATLAHHPDLVDVFVEWRHLG